MDFEPWWLIIFPVLFALGWVAARIDFRQLLSESKNLPDSYFKGLNFLLNEQPDRAIDAFVEVAKLDPETTELHFALGGLFRRRGEIERAIRVHQSLLARADLPQTDRDMAQYALAQDYLKAGLLDRAEEAFEAVTNTRFRIEAMRALIRIYESEHDWPKAIDAVQRLRTAVDEPVPQLVHYHCEGVQAALQQREPNIEQAQKAIAAADAVVESAQATSASKARIHMLKARLAALQGNFQVQQQELLTVLEQSPEYAGLVAKDLMEAYRKLGAESEGLSVLRKHYAMQPSLELFDVVFKGLRQQEGYAKAWAFSRTALRERPLLLGLERMVEVELSYADNLTSQPITGAPVDSLPTAAAAQVVAGADLSLLKRIIRKHAKRLDRYACKECGFEAQHYYWQCPGCNAWESYAPKRLEEMQ